MIASDDYQDANKKWRLPSLKDTLILCTTEVDLVGSTMKASLQSTLRELLDTIRMRTRKYWAENHERHRVRSLRAATTELGYLVSASRQTVK